MMRNWYGRSIVDPADEQTDDMTDRADAGSMTDDRQALPSDDSDYSLGGGLRPTGGAPTMTKSIEQSAASVDMAMPGAIAANSETI